MSWKIAMPTAVLTTAAIGTVLIHLERTAPLPEKPSIRLRVWTGDLPAADLAQVLANETAKVEALKAERATLAASLHARQELGETLAASVGQLDARVQEKQTTEWASGTAALPR